MATAARSFTAFPVSPSRPPPAPRYGGPTGRRTVPRQTADRPARRGEILRRRACQGIALKVRSVEGRDIETLRGAGTRNGAAAEPTPEMQLRYQWVGAQAARGGTQERGKS